MTVLAIYPADPTPELAQLLDLSGFVWKGVSQPNDVENLEPDEGWGGAILHLRDKGDAGWAMLRALRKRDVPVSPLLLLIRGNELQELDMRDELFDDFCLDPFHPRELEARIRHMLASSMDAGAGERIEYGPLVLDLETYEAAVDGRPLDLTFMEYELLRFLAATPGRVFTREILLNRVWGYEYYGGARTVDVHVRRLRAKFGEEYAGLIHTVRSVGYRFGQARRR
ncbi:MAG: response regulator transcription factor [Actinomycetota bacterium]|jgi:DNA-binding response OmpR family regulator|nr:response regulator transcription factor [Actinomycetota bacterium]MEC9338731.1 response regulator transcription factor [Actinomycetota bacterium]MED6304810.1 response regulator transcription factor [Actinomycetota bacterium]